MVLDSPPKMKVAACSMSAGVACAHEDKQHPHLRRIGSQEQRVRSARTKDAHRSEDLVWDGREIAAIKPQGVLYRQEQQQRAAVDDGWERKSEGEFGDARCLIDPFPFAQGVRAIQHARDYLD